MNVRMNRIIIQLGRIFTFFKKQQFIKTAGPLGNQHLEPHQEVELEGVQLEIDSNAITRQGS
jgi:hypothetical protein